ncbi:hypothetical protein [Streptomyces sp. SBT349]|uniref:hypothetical protein n=1 Tax=Streptomyces sp. SBT349 TaxID=1580539 RepID=UPI00066B1301|nr:hypothetical protein [Streptomyces sp. SBT349]
MTAPASGPPSVEDRVRGQAAVIAATAFTAFLPLVLVTLTTISIWTGAVNVMAMHAYLDHPGATPGVMWAVPVAVQAFIIVGEVTMVLNSVLRRTWILVSGAAAAVAGYGVEIGAHIHYGEQADAIGTMIVAAIACGGGWALVAALMDRGVEIANGRTDEHPQPMRAAIPAPDPEATADTPEPAPAPARESDTPEPDAPPRTYQRKRQGRRTREQLLREVRVLAPQHAKLSPNWVASQLGISWVNARALLNDAGRLATPPPTRRGRMSTAMPSE